VVTDEPPWIPKPTRIAATDANATAAPTKILVA
jgi:hypothetical protein